MPELIRKQNDLVEQVLDPVEALRMLAKVDMTPFTKGDWLGFAGCESKDPLIGQHGEFTIILDGSMLSILHDEDEYGGTLFELIGRN